jgi:lactoylglutathione lyase
MQLAKPSVDIALLTNDPEAIMAFWMDEGAAVIDRTVPLGPGQTQHRFEANGSALKINHHERPLPDVPPSGYRGLVLPRPGLRAPCELADPDGNRLTLVPPGHDGITQAAIRLAVRNLDGHRRFYSEALGLPERAPGCFHAGETLILMEKTPDAPDDAQMLGRGWRYITLQVMKLMPAHERALAFGAREASAPATVGDHVRYSMIRDPDGNWIELAQRADLAGSID